MLKSNRPKLQPISVSINKEQQEEDTFESPLKFRKNEKKKKAEAIHPDGDRYNNAKRLHDSYSKESLNEIV